MRRSAGVLVVLCGCASVLGVDKTYELGDAGSAGSDTGTAGDAAGDASGAPQIRCAPGSVCSPATQECCLGGDGGLACSSTAVADPCPDGTDIPCDDPSDCATGDSCCAQLDSSQDLLATRCAASCSGGEVVLCDPHGAACAQGSCTMLSLQPDPPLTPGWFSGCQ